jgi:hypothetical protein
LEVLEAWTHTVHFIKEAYGLPAGVQNAIDEVWQEMSHLLDKNMTVDKIKSEINEFIETYIQEKIIFAQ